MSYGTEIIRRKDVILKALDDLVAQKKPPRGEIWVRHLRNRIDESNEIQYSVIIAFLACAGYTLDEIMDFLEGARLSVSGMGRAMFKALLIRALFAPPKSDAEGGLPPEVVECLGEQRPTA